MKTAIFVSVIVPVYNCKQYLKSAIESVLTQPYDGIEIVLVNDGSTDGSGIICDELSASNENIHVIHQANMGVSAARNAGIHHVLNEKNAPWYVAFLDADDLWCKCVTSDNVRKINSLDPLPDIIALGACGQKKNRYSYPCTYRNSHINGGNEAIWALKNHFGANLYRTELLRKYNILFTEGLKYSEDKIFLMKCAFLAEEILTVSDLLYIVRDNDYSAMKRSRSIEPIDYYLPIIRGWIDSDCWINKWEEVTKQRTNGGKILAGIYFMDMAKDHYKKWGTRMALDLVLKNHPDYDLFVDMEKKNVSSQQYKDHELMLHNPFLFEIKYRIAGFVERIAYCCLRIPLVRDLRDRRRYPLTQMPGDVSKKKNKNIYD